LATTDDSGIKALLREAEDAGRKGDAAGMVRALFASNIMDWAVWKVAHDFHGKLGADDARDCVAEAVASCYSALVGGKQITTVVGYILKAARHLAVDLAATTDEHVYTDPDSVADMNDPEQDAAREEVRSALRKEALQRARALLPQLGQDNIQMVMEVIFDAIENDIVDLTDEAISAITGLVPDTVRRLKNRGFERLRRLAAERGYNIATYDRAVASVISSNVDPDDSTNRWSDEHD
jgi:RNA polymerase sigma factor (sigma-70 family)